MVSNRQHNSRREVNCFMPLRISAENLACNCCHSSAFLFEVRSPGAHAAHHSLACEAMLF
jgi:hypothetical protein